jgi:hypothetical protein
VSPATTSSSRTPTSSYTCFRREVVEAITIREDRFGVEPELTAKVAGGGWRFGLSRIAQRRTRSPRGWR